MSVSSVQNMGEGLGASRVLAPSGVLPQPAERLDASGPVRTREYEVAVDRLCLDSTSFANVRAGADGDPGDPDRLWRYQARFLREFGATLAAYDAVRRMSVALGREGIEELFASGVFSESLVSPAVADSLARDTGVASKVLDPIEGLSDETSGEDYLSLMRANLQALREANGCE